MDKKEKKDERLPERNVASPKMDDSIDSVNEQKKGGWPICLSIG